LYALVDHNVLLPAFSRPEGPEVKVTGIIDHHEDDGKHPDALPRNIFVPLGSCASLVAQTFQECFLPSPTPTIPKDPATLLLTAIYIDTAGLKPNGKAQPIDYGAAALLESFAGHASKDSLVDDEDASSFRKTTAKELISQKLSIAHLSTRNLLRRDFKQYAFTTADGVPLSVVLSTVPLGLKPWLEKERALKPGFRHSMEQWVAECRLDVTGVLTMYKSATKGNHK
jgi:exopolyphosphatase